MEKLITILTSVVLSLILVLAVSPLFQSPPSLGAQPGNDFSNRVTFNGGVTYGNNIASSSQASAITMSAADFRAWANADFVSYSPGLTAVTLTFPASSSVPDLVPLPGDTQRVCINNATSTALTFVTFAGSAGIKLQTASSSATSVGSTKLATGKYGCFTFIRDVATSSGYDINALYEAYN